MRKVALYIRVSTEEQAQITEGSLESQKYRLEQFLDFKNASESGWGKIVKVYKDEGISAKDTNRPAFQAMMRDVRRGKVDIILVTELSRLSRNILDFCLILEELKKCDAEFLSIKEQFDTSTPVGEMMVFNMMNLAQFERKQTSERVSLNCHSRAKRGLNNGGTPILGYDTDQENKGLLIINQVEAAQVRKIFDIFLAEGSLSKTVKWLSKSDIKPKVIGKRTKKNVERKSWTTFGLRNLLRNKAYIGIKEVNKSNKDKDQSRLKSWQRYEIVEAAWPGVVEKDIFNRVQDDLDNTQKKSRKQYLDGTRRHYLLSGLIRCPECDGPMVGHSAHGKKQVHRYYGHQSSKGEKHLCRLKRFSADEIERSVTSRLVDILRDSELFDRIEESIGKSLKLKKKDRSLQKEKLQRDLSNIDMQIEKVFEMQVSMSGSDAIKMASEKLERLAKEKSQIKFQLAEMDYEIEDMTPSAHLVCEDLKNKIVEFRRGWKKATPHQQKKLIRAVIEKLVPSRDGLLVYYRSLGSDKQKNSKVVEIPTGSGLKSAVGSDFSAEPREGSHSVRDGAPGQT